MKEKRNKKVFMAMSGGVDSSVAALLLKKAGYKVTGVFIRGYNIDGCAERDGEDARRVAAYLNIPFYVFNFEKEYKDLVVDYMIDGYRQGITPNPDVMCNKEIKFGLFLKKALALGADYIATGHYVRLRRNLKFKNFSLHIARDLNKDQSYFLWTLTQEQLKHCLFPIGDYLKSEVREIARQAGLPTAEKKDSQGICFLGKVTLVDFLKKYIPEKRGVVLTTTGEKIGEHQGVWFYTIGQRHLGIKNYEARIKGRSETPPVYVVEKNVESNIIVVAEGDDNLALYKKEIKLTDVNFINPQYSNILQNVGMSVLARIRYRQPLVKASIIINKESEIKNQPLIPNSKFLTLKFDQPVKFVAPGQSAVFYNEKGEMLGGGVIV